MDLVKYMYALNRPFGFFGNDGSGLDLFLSSFFFCLRSTAASLAACCAAIASRFNRAFLNAFRCSTAFFLAHLFHAAFTISSIGCIFRQFST